MDGRVAITLSWRARVGVVGRGIARISRSVVGVGRGIAGVNGRVAITFSWIYGSIARVNGSVAGVGRGIVVVSRGVARMVTVGVGRSHNSMASVSAHVHLLVVSAPLVSEL